MKILIQACNKYRLVDLVTYMDDIIEVSIKWQLVRFILVNKQCANNMDVDLCAFCQLQFKGSIMCSLAREHNSAFELPVACMHAQQGLCIRFGALIKNIHTASK